MVSIKITLYAGIILGLSHVLFFVNEVDCESFTNDVDWVTQEADNAQNGEIRVINGNFDYSMTATIKSALQEAWEQHKSAFERTRYIRSSLDKLYAETYWQVIEGYDAIHYWACKYLFMRIKWNSEWKKYAVFSTPKAGGSC